MRHVFRYLVDAVPAEGERLTLAPADAHHLTRVVRRGVGEVVEVADGAGARHRAEVVEAGERVVVAVGAALPALAPAPVRLGVAPMEAGRLDLVAEKAAELGVERLVVVSVARARRTPDAAAWERRRARLERVVAAACRQCGRARLMPVEGLVPFAAIVAETPGADGILIDPRGPVPLGAALAARPEDAPPVTVLVGPEAGFAAEEVAAAAAAGWGVAHLGPAVLRAETAALAAATLACAAAGGLG